MKKEVPLGILKAIEPVLDKLKSNNIAVERNNNLILRVVDTDKESSLFFEITGYEMNNAGANNLKLRYKPKNEIDPTAYSTVIEAKNFEGSFLHWFKLVEGYNNVKSVFDDPILKKYADDFFEEFVSADSDASITSFNLTQQLLLDGALTQVIHALEAKKDEANEELVAELIEQAEEIQNTLTEDTKQESLSKLSKFLAKVQKGGIKLIKEVYPIVQKEIIGTIVKAAITAGTGAVAAAHLLH
jgi:hypothetical protein